MIGVEWTPPRTDYHYDSTYASDIAHCLLTQQAIDLSRFKYTAIIRSKIGPSWIRAVMFNKNIQWNSNTLKIFFSEARRDRSTFSIDANLLHQCNPSVFWSHEDIEEYKLDLASFSRTGKTHWTKDFINKNVDKLDFYALSANYNVPWDQELISSFSEKISWKNLIANPSLQLTPSVLCLLKQKVSMDESAVSSIISNVFRPLESRMVFVEANEWIKMCNPALHITDKSMMKALSKNLNIVWSKAVLEFGIEHNYLDLEEMCSNAINAWRFQKIPFMIDVSEELLKQKISFFSEPLAIVHCPLVNFWSIEKIERILGKDPEVLSNLSTNPFMNFNDDILEYLYRFLEQFDPYRIIFGEDCYANPSFYNYVVEKYSKKGLRDISLMLNVLNHIN